MTVWGTPVYPEKGRCRIQPHGSKLWQAGWEVVDWQSVSTPICRNTATGNYLAMEIKRVEVEQ